MQRSGHPIPNLPFGGLVQGFGEDSSQFADPPVADRSALSALVVSDVLERRGDSAPDGGRPAGVRRFSGEASGQ